MVECIAINRDRPGLVLFHTVWGKSSRNRRFGAPVITERQDALQLFNGIEEVFSGNATRAQSEE